MILQLLKMPKHRYPEIISLALFQIKYLILVLLPFKSNQIAAIKAQKDTLLQASHPNFKAKLFVIYLRQKIQILSLLSVLLGIPKLPSMCFKQISLVTHMAQKR